MTRLLKEATATVSRLPEQQQNEFALVLLQLAGVEQPVTRLSLDEEADLEVSLAQADAGDLATDEEIEAVWAKHGS